MNSTSTASPSPNSYLPFACLALLASLPLLAAQPTTQPVPQTPSQLYNLTAVHTIHLHFTPDQWQAIEPKSTGRSPFGGPRPGGPGVFGPASFLAPVFMTAADQNRDQKISKDEFHSLADKWFTDWDKEKTAKLTPDQLRAGLNATFTPPGFSPPPQNAPRPRQPGIILQGQNGRRNGLASAMGLEFNYVHANLDFNGQLINDVAVRYKGNGTWMESTGSIKRSLKIQLDHFTKGQSLASVSTLNLHNCVTDASFMNEVLSHKLFRDAQVPAPRTAYARVYVSVAGKLDRKYFGLYSMVEDIDATFTKETFARKGGAIFKPVTPFPFIDLGPNFDAYKQIYDPKTKLSDSEKQRLIEFCRLVSSADDAEFAANLPQYLDLDNFARFMAIEVYLSTLDSILSIGQNYYVYLHPKTNQFHFLPWDLDHSFGQFPMIGTQQQREQLSIHHPWRGDIRFLDRVYKVPAFKTLYLAKLDEFSKTIFIPDRFHKQVDDIAAAIRPAAQDESPVKFQRLNRVAAGQSPDGPGIADAFFGRGRGSLMDSRKPIKPFTIARSQSILDQLSGKSPGLSLPETGFGAPPPTPPAQDRGRIARTGINPQTRPASPSAFGPGNFLAPAFLAAFDSNKDNLLTRDELLSGFDNWFTSWNTDRSNLLTDEQLRIGLNKALIPPPPAPGSPTMIPLNAPPPSPPTR